LLLIAFFLRQYAGSSVPILLPVGRYFDYRPTKSINRVVHMPFGAIANPDVTYQLIIATAQNRRHQRQ
jgi:hypothetical protein